MPLNADRLLALEIPPFEFELTERDTLFYALSVGAGDDPVDERFLPFVHERPSLKALPTLFSTTGRCSDWIRDPENGITFCKMLNGAQMLKLSATPPTTGIFTAMHKVRAIIDLSAKGAIIVLDRTIYDGAGQLIATIESQLFCRSDGGCGGPQSGGYPFVRIPDRPCDRTELVKTFGNSALLFRLNGDLNPLHADPEVAARAGFERPILHGLATFGMTAVALARAGFGRPDALRQFGARFSAAVLPGEQLCLQIWKGDRGRVQFQVVNPAGTPVLDRGEAEFIN